MSVIRCKIPSNSVEWSDPNGKPGRKDFEMENYIMLDGQKFEIDEKNLLLLRAVVGEQKEKEKLFTREEGQIYYYISGFGSVSFSTENEMRTDDNRYEVGNYCTDEKLMEQRALHETLNRLLWRFSEMYGGDVGWNGENDHFYIVYNKINNEYLVSDCAYMKTQGVIYFPSIRRAQEAIEIVVKPFVAAHPDFVW